MVTVLQIIYIRNRGCAITTRFTMYATSVVILTLLAVTKVQDVAGDRSMVFSTGPAKTKMFSHRLRKMAPSVTATSMFPSLATTHLEYQQPGFQQMGFQSAAGSGQSGFQSAGPTGFVSFGSSGPSVSHIQEILPFHQTQSAVGPTGFSSFSTGGQSSASSVLQNQPYRVIQTGGWPNEKSFMKFSSHQSGLRHPQRSESVYQTQGFAFPNTKHFGKITTHQTGSQVPQSNEYLYGQNQYFYPSTQAEHVPETPVTGWPTDDYVIKYNTQQPVIPFRSSTKKQHRELCPLSHPHNGVKESQEETDVVFTGASPTPDQISPIDTLEQVSKNVDITQEINKPKDFIVPEDNIFVTPTQSVNGFQYAINPTETDNGYMLVNNVLESTSGYPIRSKPHKPNIDVENIKKITSEDDGYMYVVNPLDGTGGYQIRPRPHKPNTEIGNNRKITSENEEFTIFNNPLDTTGGYQIRPRPHKPGSETENVRKITSEEDTYWFVNPTDNTAGYQIRPKPHQPDGETENVRKITPEEDGYWTINSWDKTGGYQVRPKPQNPNTEVDFSGTSHGSDSYGEIKIVPGENDKNEIILNGYNNLNEQPVGPTSASDEFNAYGTGTVDTYLDINKIPITGPSVSFSEPNKNAGHESYKTITKIGSPTFSYPPDTGVVYNGTPDINQKGSIINFQYPFRKKDVCTRFDDHYDNFVNELMIVLQSLRNCQCFKDSLSIYFKKMLGSC